MVGHFSSYKLFRQLTRRGWSKGTNGEVCKYMKKGCPDCAVLASGGRVQRLPLNSIAISRPFLIIDIDIMEIPRTQQDNNFVLILLDMFSKWPMVFVMPYKSWWTK